MTKTDKDVFSFLGTCRSGTAIRIPYGLTFEDAPGFCEAISVADKVDFYCVAEYTVWRRQKRQELGSDLLGVSELYACLEQEAKQPEMLRELVMLQLWTSIDRVRHGQELAI